MLDVLLVDDEPSMLGAVSEALTAEGHSVETASDGSLALEALSERRFDLVLCDMRLPIVDGLGVFRHSRRVAPATDFVFITAFGGVEEAVLALKEGATDYLTKPFRLEQLQARVRQIGRARELRRELALVRTSLTGPGATRAIGRSVAFRQALARLPSFAESDYPVLILGESGTGKELVTQMLHKQSQRAERPLVTLNCAALPESLLEAELFGYRRGAFTGAAHEREGRFKTADGGTIFLDEVAEMPLGAQAKLLRVLQEGVFEPLGSDKSVRVNVRIVSATHRDLKEFIARGLFREDLYYRLKVLTIEVPPLRARRGDVLLLVEHFLTELHHPGGASNVSGEALGALEAYSWPGNVRELVHALQYASVLARGRTIEVGHLPDDVVVLREPVAGSGGQRSAAVGEGLPKEPPASMGGPSLATGAREQPVGPLAAAMAAYEQAYLERVLQHCGGRRAEAAATLQISRKGLWQKLKRHGL